MVPPGPARRQPVSRPLPAPSLHPVQSRQEGPFTNLSSPLSHPSPSECRTVVHAGVTHQVCVRPGVEGQAEFLATVRRIFQLGEDEEISLSFGCKLPNSCEEVTLEGSACFDAAVYLASLSAGQRLQRQKDQGVAAAATAGDGGNAGSGAEVEGGGAGHPRSSPRSVADAVRRLFS